MRPYIIDFRRPRAFTLVELLVVLAIIGVLIAMLIPSARQARESARVVMCQSQVRSYNIALATYVTTNRERFISSGNTSNWAAFRCDTTDSPPLIDPYLDFKRHKIAQTNVPGSWSSTYNTGIYNTIMSLCWVPGPFACPNMDVNLISANGRPVLSTFYPMYALNGNLSLTIPSQAGNPRVLRGRPLSAISNDSRMIATYEWTFYYYGYRQLPEEEGQSNNAGTAAPGWSHHTANGNYSANSTGTLSFLDGHVVTVSANKAVSDVQQGAATWYLK